MLSEYNKQIIYENIINNEEPLTIVRLIMFYGKVKFKIACMFRYQAIEWLKNEDNKQRVLSAHEEEEVHPYEEMFKEVKREGCITCGCKDFLCDCEVKRTEDIPF